MNKKLLTSIAAALALLLVGPVWADGEDDELEITIQMIDNPEEVSNSFIIVLGADDSAAGEGDGGDRGESGQESNEGDHGDGDLLAGVEGDHGDGDVLDGDEGVSDGGDGDHNGSDEGVSDGGDGDGDRFASDLRVDEGFDLVDDNDASDTMDEGDVTEDQERHPEEGNGDDGMTDETVGDEVADATGSDMEDSVMDEADVATDEETDNPDEQTDLVE